MTTKRYSEEFKQSMIRPKNGGRSATSLLKEYNVSVSTICKWIQQDDSNNTNVLSIKERELIKENKQLKEESDILKRTELVKKSLHKKFYFLCVNFCVFVDKFLFKIY
ncbi:transposase [Vagococcus fluvialis]|uniref:Transposase n=1 Tax=Vagococcus fluvialis TaxID=2738 RepID=A0A7X6DA05_9ENTE|nr:transposase [Vagococcus fluvialis]NKC68462.1 transposase [Vagococcus fluvialis]